MKTAKILLSVIIFMGTIMTSSAQIDFGSLSENQLYKRGNKYNNWTVGIGFGPVFYYTDVIDYTLFPKDHYRFAPSISVARQLNRPWGIEAKMMMVDMYGEKNGRYFSGNLIDATMNLTLSINQLAIFGPISDRWNIFAKLGVGMVFFRSKVRNLNDNSFKTVQDVYSNLFGYPNPYGWADTDYLVIGYDRKNDPSHKTKRKSEVVVPIGVGAQYRINERLDAGFELIMHSMTADNLDVNLSGADNDTYLYPNFTIRYKIGKKNRRHAVWTYKDFNLSQQRNRLTDPLAQKLDSLKQRLDDLAANDSVTNDTTVIYTESIITESEIDASVFFDFDKSNITMPSQYTLSKIAKAMYDNPEMRIVIRGYCDARGSLQYNEALSKRRCNSVLDVLTKDYGLSPDRFELDPKGKTELLSDTDKLKPRGIHLVNRRVDLIMIK